jgi:hypothetical protein
MNSWNSLLPVNKSSNSRRDRITRRRIERQGARATRRLQNKAARQLRHEERRKDRRDKKQGKKRKIKLARIASRRNKRDVNEKARADAMLERRPNLQKLQNKYGKHLKKNLTAIPNPKTLYNTLMNLKKYPSLDAGNNTILEQTINSINKTWKNHRFGKNRSNRSNRSKKFSRASNSVTSNHSYNNHSSNNHSYNNYSGMPAMEF